MQRRTLRLIVAAATVGMVVAACGSKSPTQPTSCTATLSPAAASFDSNGGGGSVALDIAAGCRWTAASSAAWLTLTGASSGSGPGTIGYTVAANASADARAGSLSAAGVSHDVAQQGRPAVTCVYELSPTEVRLTKDATAGSVGVNTAAGCAWSAKSDVPWFAITGGESGNGPGVVNYEAARNLDVLERKTAVTIAGSVLMVTQSGDTGGCSYSVSPVNPAVCMASGTITSTITTQPGCSWTAAVDSSWLSIVGASSGTGPATLTVGYSSNYDAPRAGIVMVRWPTPTEGQNVHLAQAGCRYAVSRTAFTFAAAGGPGTFDVIQQSDPTECGGATQDRCVWTATSSDPWITITSGMPRMGDNPVSFAVAANPSGASRSGTIKVRDKVVTITQGPS